MAARYVRIGQYPDYRDEIRGTLLEILASTANPGTYAAPEDVAGCTLEMGADGLWTGNLGTLTAVQVAALPLEKLSSSWRYTSAESGEINPIQRMRTSLKYTDSGIIAFVGDSTTSGVGGGGGATLNEWSWVNRSVKLLNAGVAMNCHKHAMVLPTSNLSNNNNSMWTLSGTWSLQSFGAANAASYKVSGSGTLIFSPNNADVPYNEFVVGIICNSLLGTLTLTPSDGSTPIVVNCAIGKVGIQFVRVPLALPTVSANLAITLTAGTQGYICACGIRNSSSPSIGFANLGLGSTKAYGNWDDNSPFGSLPFLTSLPKKASVIMLGRNDVLQRVSVTNYANALTTLCRTLSTSGPVAIATFVPSSDPTAINDPAFVSAMHSVAAATRSMIIPIYEQVFGGVYAPNLMSDANHPNQDGYDAIAGYLASWIQGA